MKTARGTVAKKSFDIVITLLSIIQGLAFGFLAEKFPEIYEYTRKDGDYLLILYFAVAFAILLRVFQTYVTAIVDYADKGLTLGSFDLFTIFLVGLLEYFTFAALTVTGFDPREFTRRLLILVTLSLVGYVIAHFRIQEDDFQSYGKFKLERRLQKVNILGTCIVALVATLVVMRSGHMSPISENLAPAILTIVVLSNIWYSVWATFRESPNVRSYIASPEHLSLTGACESEALLRDHSHDIRQCGRGDVISVVDILVEDFGYVYSSLFGTNAKMTRSILRRLLILNRGNHPLGFRNFRCAVSEEDPQKVVGVSLVGSQRRPSTALALRACIVVVLQIGVVGLVRAIRNFKTVGSAQPVVIKDALNLVYVAVEKGERRQGVGRLLILDACAVARDRKKECVVLEVREKNAGALAFFRTLGFRAISVVESSSDALFERGRRILMKRDVA